MGMTTDAILGQRVLPTINMSTALSVGAAIVVLVLVRFAATIYRCWRIGRKLRHLPGPPSSLFGPLDELARPDHHRFYTELAAKYGPVVTYRALTAHTILLTDPVLVAEALRHKRLDKVLPEPFSNGAIDKFTGPKAHQTILTLPTDERWKIVRKAVAAAMSTSNMRAVFPGIRKVGHKLVQELSKIGENAIIDMDNVLCRESLDVIGQVGFGRDMGATNTLLDGDAVGQAIHITQKAQAECERNLSDPLRKYKIWRRDYWEGRAAYARFHEMTKGLLAEMRARRPDRACFGVHLLDIKDPQTGRPLDDEHLLPEFALLFLAGFETTGHTASWTLYGISQDAKIEAKITEELDSLGLLATPERPQPRPIEWEDIPKLVYLNAVIKEGLRRYPAGGVATFRSPIPGQGDVSLGGGRLIIPEGAILHMPIVAMHMLPTNWDDPDKFNPDRWFEEGAEVAPGAPQFEGKAVRRFMAFGEGSRNCVGQTLAKLNLATALAQLYGSFTFRLADEMGTPQDVYNAEQVSFTLSCAKGMKMHAIRRVAADA